MENQNKLETEYKGFVCAYREYNNTWEAKDTETELTAESLSELKTMIDKHIKKKTSFDRVDIYMGAHDLAKGTVTSVTDEQGYSGISRRVFWISYKTTSYGKETTSRMKSSQYDRYPLVTPENTAIIEQIISLEKQARELEKRLVFYDPKKEDK